MTGDGSLVYVSRFITPPLPGESTAVVQTVVGGNFVGAEVAVINAAAMTLRDTIVLRHSDKPDGEIQGRGVPNYLGAAAISPDGRSAWVPSKQDNVKRGGLRDGLGLNFENTVRAISSRLDLVAGSEDYAARIDHDNSGVASAAIHDRIGVHMFVALEASREVAVVDAHGGWEIFRINTGRAPQGLALSVDGRTLYVSNFMDRTVSVFDVSALLAEGIANVPLVATMQAVGTDKLSAQVLKGKQFFYDAKDPRLARDAYVSCASCHNDGGHDGRVWDLTGFGEGLRNTTRLRGRAGAQGFLHWSNNFDEVQDFEGQIRSLAGGAGLMTNAQFSTGTRSEPLGDRKAGVSGDLDALAAYVASLNTFPSSPLRASGGGLTTAGSAGRTVFIAKNCASCHGGTAFTNSASSNPQDIGTITAGQRQPPGRPADRHRHSYAARRWATAPYLHNGSAATLDDCDPCAQRPYLDRHGVGKPRRVRSADRQSGDDCTRGQHLEHWNRARRPVFQQHDALGCPRSATDGGRQLRLEYQLARAGRQYQQVLRALDRQGGGHLDRQFPVPDGIQRRCAPVDQWRPRHQQLDQSRYRQ